MKPPSRSVFHPNPAGQVGLWRNRMGQAIVGCTAWERPRIAPLVRSGSPGTTPVQHPWWGSPAPYMRVGRSPSPPGVGAEPPGGVVPVLYRTKKGLQETL